MLRRAATSAGARIANHTALVGAELARDGWRLSVRSPAGASTLDARFVVDASGRSRRLARFAGMADERLDTMIACFAYAASRPGAIVETFVEATRDGWWYTAPLPGGRAVVAFLTDPRRVAPGADHDLAAAVPPAIADRIEAAPPSTRFRKVAADSARLLTAAGDRWIAVGDAAATHDPLAAQGIDRALRSGLRAAEAIALALRGHPGALRRYAEMQRASFDAYVQMRQRFYALERRWPDAAFWADRWRGDLATWSAQRAQVAAAPQIVDRAGDVIVVQDQLR